MSGPPVCRCGRHIVDGDHCFKSGKLLRLPREVAPYDQRVEIELLRGDRRRERRAEAFGVAA